MKVFDGSFLTFQGNPVPGRAPAAVTVHGGQHLTPDQAQAVHEVYLAFRDAVRLSIAAHHTDRRLLRDGTVVEVVSNGDLDWVDVWPPPPRLLPTLADLFYTLPGYVESGGYPPYDPNFSAKWSFRQKSAAPTSLKPARTPEETAGIRQHPGNLTWFSDAVNVNNRPIILSWHGRATRYGRLNYHGRDWQCSVNAALRNKIYGPANSAARTNWKDAFKASVWLNGVRHTVALADDTPVRVISCALKKPEAEPLQLYVLSYDGNTLAVYAGAITPYSGQAVVVEKLFDTDYTVSTSIPFGSTNPLWEGMLQLPYFNGSCTALAGLVAVRGGSAGNPEAATALAAAGSPAPSSSAFYVMLMQVDLEAETTSFTAEHVSNTSEVDTTGEPVYSGGFGGSEAFTLEHTTTTIRYGAVDYDGDQLLIALVRNTNITRREESGMLVDGGDASGTSSKSGSIAVENSYRIYLHHNDYTLASHTGTEVPTGTIDMEGSWTGPAEEGDPFTGTGNGTREEDIDAVIQFQTTVEGGDLRQLSVVAGEFVEAGDSYYSDTLAPNDVNGVAWTPVAWGGMTRSVVTDTRQRQPALRFTVWRNGALVEEGPYLTPSSRGDRSRFGWMAGGTLGTPPGGSSSVESWFAFNVRPSEFATTRRDILQDWVNWKDDLPSLANPLISVGRPYVATSAYSADGLYWFFNIGPAFYGNGSMIDSPAGTAMNPVAAFVLQGDEATVDAAAIVTGDDPAFASPVFLDNVPEAP